MLVDSFHQILDNSNILLNNLRICDFLISSSAIIDEYPRQSKEQYENVTYHNRYFGNSKLWYVQKPVDKP